MSKRFIVTIATIIVIIVAAGGAVFLAKGYSISATEKRIVGSGILTVTSEPDAASIFIDDHLTSATDATISSLPPKDYMVRVVKEGFIPWERSVRVREGLVTELKITLFPAIPTIYPLTFNGVANPVLSPDGSRLAFLVPKGKKSGIWVWTQSRNQPIAFIRSSEPHLIANNIIQDFSTATLKWSPDSKQVLATVNGSNFLLDADKLNTDPRDITPIISSTEKGWDDDVKLKDELRIESIKDLKYRKIASESGYLRWSPDETKFFASKEKISSDEAMPKVTVYDLEEEKEYLLPEAKSYLWLPDSLHIILVEDKAISVIDIDGTNKAVIYAGTFANNFVFPWLDSSRLVIISSSPTPTASEPNLYGINLK